MEQDRLIILSRDQGKDLKVNKFKSWQKMWKKKSVSERVILWIMFGFFIVYGFTLLYPLFWALINSFKTSNEYYSNKFSFPKDPVLNNYTNIDDMKTTIKASLVESIWNSVWMSTLSTGLGLFASCLTSYVVARYRFKMSGFIYAAVVLVQIIPLVGSIAGMYELIVNVLQINNQPALIWPIWFGGYGFSFLMLYGAFKSVSWSYAESAFIDGAGHFKTFFRIMLPQVKPVLSSLFIVNFIGAWNDYMTSYLYMKEYPPLALAVYLLKDDATRTSIPAYLAIVVVSLVPPLILFIAFQKLIMENTTTGGLKG